MFNLFSSLDFGLSDFIKKRVCKFLLNRYLGQFFEEKLNQNQIYIDIYNGKGSVKNVKLCCEVMSEWNFYYDFSKAIIFVRTQIHKEEKETQMILNENFSFHLIPEHKSKHRK